MKTCNDKEYTPEKVVRKLLELFKNLEFAHH